MKNFGPIPTPEQIDALTDLGNAQCDMLTAEVWRIVKSDTGFTRALIADAIRRSVVVSAEEYRVLDWLTDRVYEGRGAVTFSTTENGNIGLWIGVADDDEATPALGYGDDAEEAIRDAMRKHAKGG